MLRFCNMSPHFVICTVYIYITASLFATPSSRSQTACSCRNGAFSRKSLMVQGDCKVTLLFRHQHLSPHSMASWGRFQNTWHSRFPVPPSLSPIHLAIIPLHIMCSFRSHSKIANFAPPPSTSSTTTWCSTTYSVTQSTWWEFRDIICDFMNRGCTVWIGRWWRRMWRSL